MNDVPDDIEQMAAAGYTRNVELTWTSRHTEPPTWDTTTPAVRSVWRQIMVAAVAAVTPTPAKP